jgi:hypothetical protein
MKLTEEQIDNVSNYIKLCGIKWYELQVELTDHLVSSMEEIWQEDPKLTFHQVRDYAEKRLAPNGFNEMESERMKLLQKEFNKSQFKMIGEFLKFPKILGSVFLVILIYKSSFYFGNASKFIGCLSIIMIALYLTSFPHLFINGKIKGKRFLEIYAINSKFMGGILLCSSLNNIGLNQFGEEIQRNHLLVIPFCCISFLCFLFFITGRHLNIKVVDKIKRQYQLT